MLEIITLFDGILKDIDIEALKGYCNSFENIGYINHEALSGEVLDRSGTDRLSAGLFMIESFLECGIELMEMMGIQLESDSATIDLYNVEAMVSSMTNLEDPSNHDVIVEALDKFTEPDEILISILQSMNNDFTLLYRDMIHSVSPALIDVLKRESGHLKDAIIDKSRTLLIRKEFLKVSDGYRGVVYKHAAMAESFPISPVSIIPALNDVLDNLRPEDLAIELVSLSVIIGLPKEERIDFIDSLIGDLLGGTGLEEYKVHYAVNKLMEKDKDE